MAARNPATSPTMPPPKAMIDARPVAAGFDHLFGQRFQLGEALVGLAAREKQNFVLVIANGLVEAFAMQLEYVGGGDDKHHAGARRQKFGHAGQRAALDDGVIGSLRRFHAKAGHIRSLYHGPVDLHGKPPSFFLLLLLVVPLAEAHPSTVFWAGPAILVSAIAIAWAAESAQFFIAQGFALAILAWLQTLPEFAVEAVLAWHQQVQFLLANLTGALRLLTGFGWPVIYFTAAMFQRRRGGAPLKVIHLEEHHAVEVLGLAVPLLYIGVIAWKGSLTIYDGAVLILLYTAYLLILSRMPPEDPETIEDLEAIPRKIVTAPRMAADRDDHRTVSVRRDSDLRRRRAVSGEPAGAFGRGRNSGVRLHPMGGAGGLRVSRNGVDVLLGALGGSRADGADEHGVEQHQPVDAAHGHAADRALVQRRRRDADPVRPGAARRVAADPGPGGGRHDVPDEHAAHLV